MLLRDERGRRWRTNENSTGSNRGKSASPLGRSQGPRAAPFAIRPAHHQHGGSRCRACRRAWLIGNEQTVESFFKDVLHLAGVPVSDKPAVASRSPSTKVPRSLRNAMGRDAEFVGLQTPCRTPWSTWRETSPVVEGLASWVLDTAADPIAPRATRRRPAMWCQPASTASRSA